MKKRIFMATGALLAIAAPIAGVISCGSNSTDTKKTIAVVVSKKTNIFFQNIIDAAKNEATKRGYSIVVYDSDDKQESETTHIDNIITKGYAGVIWNPINATASKSAGEKLKTAKIPFTLVDRSLDNFKGNIALVSTDNTVATRTVIKVALDKFKAVSPAIKSIMTGHLQGQDGAAAAIARDAGFVAEKAAWETTNPGFALNIGNRTQKADWDSAKAQSFVSTWKSSTLNFIFAENDNMALGAVKAYEGDSTWPMIVGFDGLEAAKKSVDAGKMFATVEQDTQKMGELSVDIIVEFLDKNNDITADSDYTKTEQDIKLDGIVYKNDGWTGTSA